MTIVKYCSLVASDVYAVINLFRGHPIQQASPLGIISPTRLSDKSFGITTN